MAGSARLTTLKSRIGRNAPVSNTGSASHRRGSPAACSLGSHCSFDLLEPASSPPACVHQTLAVRERTAILYVGQCTFAKMDSDELGRSTSRSCGFREGTLSGAARQLRVTHSTVFRRLGAIEEQIGVRLFERFRDGYAPTPAGETAAEAAARLEDEVLTLERQLSGQDLSRRASFGSPRRIRSARS